MFFGELYEKKNKKIKKTLAKGKNIVYTNRCCDMIAVKREVAVERQVFRGANVKLEKLTTSHCTSSEDHLGMGVWKDVLGHTRRCVQSPLVVLIMSTNRRRLFLWQIR